jgi:hypothetical protein
MIPNARARILAVESGHTQPYLTPLVAGGRAGGWMGPGWAGGGTMAYLTRASAAGQLDSDIVCLQVGRRWRRAAAACRRRAAACGGLLRPLWNHLSLSICLSISIPHSLSLSFSIPTPSPSSGVLSRERYRRRAHLPHSPSLSITFSAEDSSAGAPPNTRALAPHHPCSARAAV